MSFRRFAIISCQIGAAPVIPEAKLFIGVLSLFPTHEATTKSGVYPIVQLSLKSFVVPVLTETAWFAIFNAEFAPNSKRRALLSAKISEIMKATPSGRIFLPKIGEEGGLYSSKTLPDFSILRIG